MLDSSGHRDRLVRCRCARPEL